MELLYIWIENYKNIKKQGFNFSPKHKFEFEPTFLACNIKTREKIMVGGGELTHKKKDYNLPEDFFGKDIVNITGVVGKNGVGKSSLIKAINYAFEFIKIENLNIDYSLLTYRERLDFKTKFILVFSNNKIVSINFDGNDARKLNISRSIILLNNNKTSIMFNDIDNKVKEFDKIDICIETIFYANTFENKRLAVENIYDISNTGLLYAERMDIDKYTKLFQEDLKKQAIFLKNKHQILETTGISIPKKIRIYYKTYFGNRGIITKYLLKENIKSLSKFEIILLGIIDYWRTIIGKRKCIDKFNIKKSLNKNKTIEGEEGTYFKILDKVITKEKNEDKKNDIINFIKTLRGELINYFSKELNIEDVKENGEFNIFTKKINNRFENDKKTNNLEKIIKDLNDYNKYFNFEDNITFLDKILDYKFLFKNEETLIRTNTYKDELFDINLKKEAIEEENIVDFIEKLYKAFKVPAGVFMKLSWIGLSSGEIALINTFSRFYNLKIQKNQNIIITIDEGELYLHPEWQRKYFGLIQKAIPLIFPDKKTQLIISSHSPFIISDIPKEHVIFLGKDDNEGNCKVIPEIDLKETFGANIHTLFTSSFFLENGLIGEFANGKINKAIEYLNKDTLSEIEIKYCEQIIKIIGEPILKNQLQRMLNNKRLKKIDRIDELDIMKKQMRYLQTKIKKIEKNRK